MQIVYILNCCLNWIIAICLLVNRKIIIYEVDVNVDDDENGADDAKSKLNI